MQFVNHIINSYNKNYVCDVDIFKDRSVSFFETGVDEIKKQIDVENVHLAYSKRQ